MVCNELLSHLTYTVVVKLAGAVAGYSSSLIMTCTTKETYFISAINQFYNSIFQVIRKFIYLHFVVLIVRKVILILPFLLLI